MLHDCFLALLGLPGDVFVARVKPNEGGQRAGTDDFLSEKDVSSELVVNSDLDFLSVSERSVLQRIASVGSDFLFVKRWIASSRRLVGKGADAETGGENPPAKGPSDSAVGAAPFSLYRQGLAVRCDALCAAFSDSVMRLEQNFLFSRLQLPFSHILNSLADEALVIKTVAQLLREIDRLRLAGVRLLDFLSRKAAESSADSLLGFLLRGLHEAVGTVFVSQLSEWVSFGRLTDECGEFFVCRNPAGWVRVLSSTAEMDLEISSLGRCVWGRSSALKGGQRAPEVGGADSESKRQRVNVGFPVDSLVSPTGSSQRSVGLLAFDFLSLHRLRAEQVPLPDGLVLESLSVDDFFFVGRAVRVLRRSAAWGPEDLREAEVAGALASLDSAFRVQILPSGPGLSSPLPPSALMGSAGRVMRRVVSERLWVLVRDRQLAESILLGLREVSLLAAGGFWQGFIGRESELRNAERERTKGKGGERRGFEDPTRRVRKAWVSAVSEEESRQLLEGQMMPEGQGETEEGFPLSEHLKKFRLRIAPPGFQIPWPGGNGTFQSSSGDFVFSGVRASREGKALLFPPAADRDRDMSMPPFMACRDLQSVCQGCVSSVSFKVPLSGSSGLGVRLGVVVSPEPAAPPASFSALGKRQGGRDSGGGMSTFLRLCGPSLYIDVAVAPPPIPSGARKGGEMSSPSGRSSIRGAEKEDEEERDFIVSVFLVSTAGGGRHSSQGEEGLEGSRQGWPDVAVLGSAKARVSLRGDDGSVPGVREVSILMFVSISASDETLRVRLSRERTRTSVGRDEKENDPQTSFGSSLLPSFLDCSVPLNLPLCLPLRSDAVLLSLTSPPLDVSIPVTDNVVTPFGISVANGRQAHSSEVLWHVAPTVSELKEGREERQENWAVVRRLGGHNQSGGVEVSAWRFEAGGPVGEGTEGGVEGTLAAAADALSLPERWRVQLRFDARGLAGLLVQEGDLWRYNRIFCLLFGLTKVKFDLDAVWRSSNETRKTIWQVWRREKSQGGGRVAGGGMIGDEQEEGRLWKKTLHVRAFMVFCVQEILLYLQQDVVEEEFGSLLETVRESRDFGRIVAAHEKFLVKTTTRAFLRIPSLLQPLLAVVAAAAEFSEVASEILEKLRESANAGILKARGRARHRQDGGDQGQGGGRSRSPPTIRGGGGKRKQEENPQRAAEWPREMGRFARQVDSLRRDFVGPVSALFSAASDFASGPSAATHALVSKLLLRLNFNHFFAPELSVEDEKGKGSSASRTDVQTALPPLLRGGRMQKRLFGTGPQAERRAPPPLREAGSGTLRSERESQPGLVTRGRAERDRDPLRGLPPSSSTHAPAGTPAPASAPVSQPQQQQEQPQRRKTGEGQGSSSVVRPGGGAGRAPPPAQSSASKGETPSAAPLRLAGMEAALRRREKEVAQQPEASAAQAPASTPSAPSAPSGDAAVSSSAGPSASTGKAATAEGGQAEAALQAKPAAKPKMKATPEEMREIMKTIEERIKKKKEQQQS
uniref:Spindle pole body component n=1 Tax=Chromera velia CCMP2878 TaxID=1169474 RepID=A0A0G4I471_9ALVE|eukprot:Cvel_10788.t1-p1 / transcript=Cvel_10788.t1 / gene=Cvel_10788 / organism=Chromera_velia_CCMP2878 / gene_product=Gamma-tubulin complex component 4 homolog, putative / transcript_product=Gamma-tubulin complex component 4 homolog, putative / location=Cvel_scaffold659:45898-54377(-) / protein_length=1503 / sequence_SO=supercontig / SO=protein_coding / is_pseudo=false